MAAKNSNLVKYANVNTASTSLLADAVKGDSNIYPPPDLLAKISNRITNEVRGINRVVYDISSKPPATIEWE